MQSDKSPHRGARHEDTPTFMRAPVVIAGQQYSSEFQLAEHYGPGWQRTLERAHGAGSPAYCQCAGRGERRLAVRCVAGVYRLARYPSTGHEHAIDCRYYGPNINGSGLRGYEAGVVREDEDGALHIRLTHSLDRRIIDPSEAKATISNKGTGRAMRVPSMTLLGLLHLLWMQAGLHQWRPCFSSTRDAFSVARRLRAAADSIHAGRHLLADALVTTAGNAGHLRTASDAAIATAQNGRRRVVCVAALRSADAPWQGRFVPIDLVPALPMTTLSDVLWEQTQHRFARELAARQRGRRVVVIGQASNPGAPASRWEWHDLALMCVTDDWLPVDSGYEAELADHLVAQNRTFEKPLRFDAHTQEVLEDFLLTDTNPPTALEVFGMDTPEYITRRDAKLDYYHAGASVKPWWYWDATQRSLVARLHESELPFAAPKNRCAP